MNTDKFMKRQMSSWMLSGVMCVVLVGPLGAAPKESVDLTKTREVDRELTYNLGATGLRGWIETRPETYLDSLQGRTTARSRQILVTHVGKGTPAEGVLRVDDVILGTGGKRFEDDARKSFARAIQAAEAGEGGGAMELTVFRDGREEAKTIKLPVLGAYGEGAPWGCEKSRRVFEAACVALEKEPLDEGWTGAVNGLALLATGKPEYLPRVKELARKLAPADLDLSGKTAGDTWGLGYRTLFLCEYLQLTGDEAVRHGMRECALSMARGQGMYGTFGHGFAALTPDGKLHGSVPPYGPVNMAGLPANLAILLAKKCGVKDPEIEAAVVRASGFFGYFTDKGAIPYGEHEPWPYHENNGKNSITAVFFGLQSGRERDAKFFAQMATAGYASRECGHTGQGFSYLWGALGANAGGPGAAAAFFRESSWHLDLVRRADGSFTYDGGEQYGPGKTEDGTYWGKSSYYGLSPNATYVLTYALPLKKLLITGRESGEKAKLGKAEVAAAVASGRFDVERKGKSAAELVAAFADWSPVVRHWAAEELAGRPEGRAMVGELVRLAGGEDVHVVQGACEALGLMGAEEGLQVLVKRLGHENRWVRYKAAEAVRKMGDRAKPVLGELLKALVATAEPMRPINWEDPVQIAQGQLAAAVFSGPLKEGLKDADPVLLIPAVRAVSRQPDGMARATLREFFDHRITMEEVVKLAPDILAAVKTPCPADTMFSNEIRMGGFKALVRYRFKEGIEAGINLAMTQGGHGSESRTGEIMKDVAGYGAAARGAVPKLKELMAMLNKQVTDGEFPGGELNERRVGAVAAAIREIEAAKDAPELRSIGAGGAAGL